MNWIIFTVFAASMQSFRTAGQKKMGGVFSPLGNTFVRFSFGLPFAMIYFLTLFIVTKNTGIGITPMFFLYITIAGLCQIFGTILQVQLLGTRNFASGTVFVKTDVMLTALIGFSFFDDILSARSWIGILTCTAGIFLLSRARGYKLQLKVFPVLLGVGAGLGFALASLFIRKASLTLTSPVLLSAATCLVLALFIQTVILTVYLTLFERQQWKIIEVNKKEATFIGFTSVAGSIGWYTAMTLTQASFVRALGQVEVIIAILITYLFFKERPKLTDWGGIVTVTCGVLLTIL